MKPLTKSQQRIIDLLQANKRDNFGRIHKGRIEVIVVTKSERKREPVSTNAMSRLMKLGFVYAQLFSYDLTYVQFHLTKAGKDLNVAYEQAKADKQ